MVMTFQHHQFVDALWDILWMPSTVNVQRCSWDNLWMPVAPRDTACPQWKAQVQRMLGYPGYTRETKCPIEADTQTAIADLG